MPRIVVWLLALGVMSAGHIAAEADSSKHPGIYLGVGVTDPSRDSLYSPIKWCGRYLWVAIDGGAVLVDPANGGAFPHHAPPSAIRDPLWYGLVACTQAKESTILWFDVGKDEISWQSLDGKRRGEVRGFARSGTIWPYPLVAVTDSLVVGIAADGRKVEASALPDGYRLVSIARASLDTVLEGSTFSFFELISPHIAQFYLSSNTYESDDGGRGQIFVSGSLLIDIDADQGPAAIRRATRISRTVTEKIDEFLEWPKLDKQGRIHFEFQSKQESRACSLSMAATSHANCFPLPEGYKTLETRLAHRFEATDTALSPSGRWFAWGEWDDVNHATARFYLALTADLLKP